MTNTTAYHRVILDLDADQVRAQVRQASATLSKMTKEIDQAQRAMKSYEKGLQNYGRASGRAANMNRRLGASMQNASYQVADIAVQMEMGTHWTRIFAQQGSQILGAFGPWAAILGAAAAAIIPLGKNLGWFGEEAEKTSDSLQNLIDEIDRLRLGVESPEELVAARARRDALQRVADIQRVINNATMEQSAALNRILLRQREIIIEANKTLRSYDEQRAILEQVEAEIAASNKRWSEMLNPMDMIKVELDSMLGTLNGLVDRAAAMAGEFVRAAQASATINQANGGLQGRFDRESYGAGQQAFRDRIQSGYTLPVDKAAGRAAGGGAEQVDEITRAIERMLPQVEKAIMEYDNWSDVMKNNLEASFVSVVENGVDTFLDQLEQGEIRMKELVKSMVREMARLVAKWAIMQSLSLAFPGINFSGGGAAFAKGGVFDGGTQVQMFAKGGVVNSPTMFPMTGGTGLMGEAGPEAIAPLRRDGSGNLGVGAVAPVINIVNNTGAQVETRQVSDTETQIIIGKAVEAAEQNFVRQAATGQGPMSRAIDQGWAAKRRFT